MYHRLEDTQQVDIEEMKHPVNPFETQSLQSPLRVATSENVDVRLDDRLAALQSPPTAHSTVVTATHVFSSPLTTSCVSGATQDEAEEDLFDSSSASASPSKICRYCLERIDPSNNVSQCKCRGHLCKDCLEGELALTHSRNNHQMHCTVCKTPYEVSFQTETPSCVDLAVFCMGAHHCGICDRNSVVSRGFVGFICITLGLTFWGTCTVLLLATPSDGTPFFLYMLISCLDIVVALTAVWFCFYLRWVVSTYFGAIFTARFVVLAFGIWERFNWLSIYEFHHHQPLAVYFIMVDSIMASFALFCTAIRDVCGQWKHYRTKTAVMYVRGLRVTIADRNY